MSKKNKLLNEATRHRWAQLANLSPSRLFEEKDLSRLEEEEELDEVETVNQSRDGGAPDRLSEMDMGPEDEMDPGPEMDMAPEPEMDMEGGDEEGFEDEEDDLMAEEASPVGAEARGPTGEKKTMPGDQGEPKDPEKASVRVAGVSAPPVVKERTSKLEEKIYRKVLARLIKEVKSAKAKKASTPAKAKQAAQPKVPVKKKR